MSKGGLEPFERGGVLPGIRGPMLTGRRRCGSGCSAMPWGRWSSTPFILVNDSGCIGHSQKAVRPPRRSWPYAQEPANGMCGSGLSTTPRVSCSWSTTRGPNHSLAATGCRRSIPVLANRDDVRYEACTGVDIVRAGRGLPQLVEAFRVGNAPPPLPWEPEGRAEPNRARFINLLGTEWLPAIVDVDVRLRAEPPARVLDVACGTGWSSIALAQAYPNIHVDGVDLDDDAIGAARRNAERAGAADRVRFSVVDAADLGGVGGYDLVTIFEALHDMARPVDALSAARRVLAEDGTVLVVDGLVAEEFAVPASPRERTEYGWSVVSCLPGAMGDPQTAATGAVMRPSMLHQYALQAGFGAVEVLPIHTEYWRFYRLLR